MVNQYSFCLNAPLTGFGAVSWYHRGMETIYLDQLFAVNFLVDYCIVLASARIAGAVLRRGRYVLAALAGALYAALSVLPPLGWLALAPVKAAVGVLMALIAFGGERRFWRCVIVLFGTAALFGGAVYALSAAAGTQPGQALQRVTWRVLIPTFAICYAVVSFVFQSRLRRADRSVVPVEVTIQNRSLTLRAICDSGNTLTDPTSGMRAAVVSPHALQPLLGALPQDPIAAVEALRERSSGARLLPYTAVGVSGGLLAAFRPQRLSAGGKALPYLVALSPTPVSPDGDYDLLLPADAP